MRLPTAWAAHPDDRGLWFAGGHLAQSDIGKDDRGERVSFAREAKTSKMPPGLA
jgi:hypothetical protein